MSALREALSVDDLLTQSDQLDEDAVRRVLDLLGELQTRVLAEIAQRPGLAASDLPALSRQIAALIAAYQQRLNATIGAAQATAFTLGQQRVETELAQAGLSTGTVGVSDQLLRVAQGISADAISGISEEARRRISRELQLAALGARTLPEVLATVGANLDSPSVFGSIAGRAEAITRTEVARIHNLGFQATGNQAAASIPGLQKQWLHRLPNMGPRFQVGKSGAKRGLYTPRPAHMALHGETIAWQAEFSVNGYAASGPHDPRLPAGEVVSCGCRLSLVLPDAH